MFAIVFVALSALLLWTGDINTSHVQFVSRCTIISWYHSYRYINFIHCCKMLFASDKSWFLTKLYQRGKGILYSICLVQTFGKPVLHASVKQNVWSSRKFALYQWLLCYRLVMLR